LRLPIPPSLEELQAHTPRISLVPERTYRPFWSVMISTYNCGHYLQRTLESVLCQDPGPDEMQIEVVDGCSTKDDPEEIVKELGKGRVTFYRLPCNQGPAHTINACIERSRGHWVHNLQGDDMVLPGFYEAYEAAIRAHVQALTVLGQVIVIDDRDRWIKIEGPIPPVGGGILADFVERQAWQQLVMCPSVVVRRDAYERIGGFCTLFRSVIDWDMWFRLGQLAPVACVPHPHALYRRHGETETVRQMAPGTHIRESYFVVKANLGRLNRSAPAAEAAWRSQWAAKADETAWALDSQNSTEGRYNHANWAWMLKPTARRFIMLLKSWLKHKLMRNPLAAVL
jgi:glycosyltransferase involved in cell wall biosynthesis